MTSATRVAIAGLGTIGRVLARRLYEGIPGLTLACAAAQDRAKAQAWLDGQGIQCPLVELDELPQHADLAIECAPAAIIERICRPMLEAGKAVMVLSCGALLDRPALVDLARERGGQIIVPTGALLGLDAVTAAAEGQITAVRMTTRKPPRGLAGAPYLVAHGISVDGLNAPKQVFAVQLGRRRPDSPPMSMWRRPWRWPGSGPSAPLSRSGLTRQSSATVTRSRWNSDSARFTLAIENIPSENPKTGRITALSVLAALRKLHAPLRVGT